MATDGFEITKLECPSPNDPRGSLWQWKFLDGRQVTICQRKAGTLAGSHVHRGDDESKNPERLFIAKGKAKITFVVTGPDGVGKREERIIEAGDNIAIQPHIPHKIEIIEDAVILEYRLTYFDSKNPDTFSVEI